MSRLSAPTFICIGIQKAGTSWLYRMVEQHPEVLASEPKELHFFNREHNYRRGLDWYLSHFAWNDQAKAAGEFTPDYLWVREKLGEGPALAATPNVPERMAEAFPDLQLIVILRNPVTRAVSSYYHHIGAARLSPNRRLSEVGDEWGILSMGHYADHLERWFRYYPRERFQILVYEEDLTGDARLPTLAKVFEHIGVDSEFQPSNPDSRYNKRRSHFDYRLSRLSGRMQRLARQYVPEFIKDRPYWDIPVSDEEMAQLEAYYQPHNERLEALLDRRLPW